MTREEYKSAALNYSVQYAAYLRNVIVAGWNPEQIKAFTESLLNEMDETASAAIEDKDLDRFDYVCVREYFDNLREGIEKRRPAWSNTWRLQMSYSDPKYLAQLEDYCHRQYKKHFEEYQMQQRRRKEREEKFELWEALEYCVHQSRNIYSTRREALNEGTYKINQFIKELYLFMERNNGGASLHELKVWMSEEGRRFLE